MMVVNDVQGVQPAAVLEQALRQVAAGA